MSRHHTGSQRSRTHDRCHAPTQYTPQLSTKAFLIVLGFLLWGCHSSPLSRFEGVAMTMPYCIQVGGHLSDSSLITDTFAEINAIFNHWNPDSEISQINRAESFQKISLSPSLGAFLKRVEALVTLTDGRFDPTVAPLARLWKEHLSQGKIPDSEELSTCSAAVGWHLIHFEGDTLWKENSLTALDLGGVAKGYCVDLLIERLHEKGFNQIYVEWGG